LWLPFCILIATILWGLKGLIDKQALTLGTPAEVYFADAIADSFIIIPMLFWYLWRRRMPQIGVPHTWKHATLSMIALAVGNVAYLVALSISSASYVITMTACYPLVMYLLAIVLLRERFNLWRLAGIALIVAGAVITQLTQGL
jgi:drug/metabolite transporter (DMT)-like permease